MDVTATNRRRILMVDDYPNLCEMVTDFLTHEGYEVKTAMSGEEALPLLRSFRPDLIILDMGMPGMGGVGFLDRITNRDGSTLYPVLVLTARAAMAEYFADKQIAGFMTKPCAPAELQTEVVRILFETPHQPAAGGMDETRLARRAVLAEADAVLADTLRQELASAGFAVEAVRTGAEALEAAIARHPDIAILRLHLPAMGGGEVAAILSRMPNVADVQLLVYGIEPDSAVVPVEQVANLVLDDAHLVSSLCVDAIIERALALTGRGSVKAR